MSTLETILILATLLGMGTGLLYYLRQAQIKLEKQRGDTKFLKEYVTTTIDEANTRFYRLMDDLEPVLVPLRDYKDKLLALIAKAEKIPWEDVEERFGEFQWILEQFSDFDWAEVSQQLKGLMDQLPGFLGRPKLTLDRLEDNIPIT